MGIPPDWPGVERVLSGKVLFAVQCHSPDESRAAIQILQETGAEEIDSIQPGT